VLTIALVLNPKALEDLTRDYMLHNIAENVMWNTFLIDLVLVSTSRAIRATAAEQFLLISTWCSSGHQALQFFITRLFPVINTTVMEYAKQSHEFFQVIIHFVLEGA
jgi:ubiquitin carboxyl-terminal hydrolase 9/24